VADAILRLEPTRLSVEPGGQATLTLTVTNPGTIVEGYSVDVVSTVPMPWVQVNPSTLSVYPQQEATAVIAFSPPSGPGAPGGTLPFGVRVWSEVEGGGSAVAEGDLDVGSVAGLQAKLTPLASTGRWSGRHTLRISNWGNAPARLRIAPEDPDQALGFLVSPEVVDVPLGGEVVSRIKVRTRHPTLRGAAQRLPFHVACEPDVETPPTGPEPTMSTAGRPVVDGAFNQKPILTRMVVAAAGLVALALIAGVVYLLTREGDPGPEESVAQPDQPTGLLAAATPGIVTLTWDRVAGVEDYKLRMTAPTDDEQPIFSAPADGDPARMESKIKVETEDDYCYRLVAVREGAADSAASEEACVTTVLPPTAPAGPTESPSIVPVSPPPGDGATDGGTDGGTTASPSADPLPAISVLQFFLVGASTDPAGDAEAARQALADQGFEAKVMSSDDWTLTPPLAAPSFLLYVDGATAADAKAACDAVAAAVPTSVPDGCIYAYAVGPRLQPSPTP
jgi:hypothetical protein